MKKDLQAKEQKTARGRKRRGSQPQDERLPGLPDTLVGLNHQVGNRAVVRWVANRAEGEAPLRGGLRAAFQQVIQGLAVKPGSAALQRQADGDTAGILDTAADVVPLDAAAGVQTGKVTLEAPQVTEYEVTGKTLSDVFSQLDPEEWGRCKWSVDYDYDTANGKATKVNITLHLVIRMPKWTTGYDTASPAARAEWQRMLRALRGHEDGHADIARKWAPRFKERMLRQPEDTLAPKYQKTFADLDAEESKFDDDTQHGQTQGVSLDTSIQ